MRILIANPAQPIISQALEMLLRGSAAVVPGVKLAQLHRLSRATGARILPSVNFLDKLDEVEVIGTAGEGVGGGGGGGEGGGQ